jgi:hypothetical protein
MDEQKTALLYSFKQKCFHIEQLKRYLITNIKYSVLYEKYQDFQLIGIFDNGLDANQWTEDNFNWETREFKNFPLETLLNNL